MTDSGDLGYALGTVVVRIPHRGEITTKYATIWQRDADGQRRLVPQPGSGPTWARYYEIGTDRPIFGDRDKTIHDKLEEISRERQRGYAWYRDTPKRALEEYAVWSKTHPQTKPTG